MIKFGYKKEL